MDSKKQRTLLPELPEDVLLKILALISLRNIARFRSVCKEWKSLLDSDFFRDLYESLNSSSSVSWSIMNARNKTLSLEIVGHHGCERWGLTNSLGSFIESYNPETTVRKTSVLSCTDGFVLLYSETINGAPMYHVGNPLLRQWVRIPLPPHLSDYDVVRLQRNQFFNDTGLVTKMERGIAVGYKVVWMLTSFSIYKELTFMIYSSETGLWETKEVHFICYSRWSRLKPSVSLNGTLHWMDPSYVVSYDFYNNNGHTIPFPSIELYGQNDRFKKTITTSAGSVVYCNVFNDNGVWTIRVWRLVNYCNDNPIAAWKLDWGVNTKSSLVGVGADYYPVVMHPFNSEIIYLWSRNNGLVLLNLRTHKFSLHKDDDEYNKCMDGCIIRFSDCKEYMDSIFPNYNNPILGVAHSINFSQFVLPHWFNPLPKIMFNS